MLESFLELRLFKENVEYQEKKFSIWKEIPMGAKVVGNGRGEMIVFFSYG